MKYSTIIIALALLFAIVDARFGQEHNKAIESLFNFDSGDGDINGHLDDISGGCNDALLVKAPPCGIQDYCDQMIDVAYFLGGKKKSQLIKIAKNIAQSEKNTPKDGLRSQICKKAPRHFELNGLHFKQDPIKSPENKKPPFVPDELTTLRKFTLKLKNKQISPNFKDFSQKKNNKRRGRKIRKSK
ncbi:1875_t:CDS:2 [Racocetra persica]|uniref:1875_t:CDS:1 n=1 Tax=Racocetra persica TaxID=160502 RepID=A0ACA9KMQ5_9GLOM|nr:1875_t:CDS:2 [Racocetra persica]